MPQQLTLSEAFDERLPPVDKLWLLVFLDDIWQLCAFWKTKIRVFGKEEAQRFCVFYIEEIR